MFVIERFCGVILIHILLITESSCVHNNHRWSASYANSLRSMTKMEKLCVTDGDYDVSLCIYHASHAGNCVFFAATRAKLTL